MDGVTRRPRYACVYVEDFLAASHVRAEPALAESPLVVLAGTPPTARVIDANRAARAAGVRPGATEADARTRCPTLVTRPVSDERTASARAGLLEAASGVSPRVEDGGAGIVYVDVAGLGRLFGDDPAVGQRLWRAARAIGLPAAIAIAGTRTTALLVARVTSRLTVVPAGDDRTTLAAVPVAALALDPTLAATFTRWGVRTLGDVAALPRAGLATRLGAAGVTAQDQALGIDHTPFRAWTPPPFWEEAQGLEWEIATWEGLRPVVEALLGRLVARLDAAHLAADGITLALAVASGGRDDRFVGFAQPLADVRGMLALLELDVAARPPGAAVTRVAVSVRAVPPAAGQRGLWQRPVPGGRDLATTLARLGTLVGPEHVGSPVALDSHRPDALALAPFAPPGGESMAPPAAVSADASALAFRRLRPPRQVAVDADAGEPLRVTLATRPECIVACVGPWRSSGEWWDTRVFARDEWDVALPDGMVCRLAHDRRTGTWFLEGAYD